MRVLALLGVVAGCGRLGFDPTAHTDNDAGVDGPLVDAPAVCTAMFCDGFEDPALAAWTGTYVGNGSTADRDPAIGFRGASLQAVGPMTTTIAGRYVDVFPGTPPPPAEQWVRAYVYASSTVTLDLEPIELTDPTHSYQFVMALYQGGTGIHAHSTAGNFEVIDSAAAPPRDRWVCYELRVAIDVVGVVELYRDGVLLISSGPLDTRPPATGLPRVVVGIASKPINTVQSIHVDEVAADTKRIGCL